MGPGRCLHENQLFFRFSSSSEDSDSDDIPCVDAVSVGEDVTNDANDEEDANQPTMWLGTEDGFVYVYNCSDNIRIKKNKIKMQLGNSVLCIV